MEKPSLPLSHPALASFFLNPEIGPEGMPRGRYLEGKFEEHRVSTHLSGQEQAGAVEGIHFNFSSIAVAPNSTEPLSYCLCTAIRRCGEFIFVLFEPILKKRVISGM